MKRSVHEEPTRQPSKLLAIKSLAGRGAAVRAGSVAISTKPLRVQPEALVLKARRAEEFVHLLWEELLSNAMRLSRGEESEP